jgi:1-acyl-sn-glycerol-3-phosphate acyltransferase
MKKIGNFTINRGVADSKAIRTALALLEEGEWVALFPEGTRSKDGIIKRGKAGSGMLAWKAKVPVVPVALIGSDHILPKGSIIPRVSDLTIRVGDPVYLEDLFALEPADREQEKQIYQEIVDRIITDIARLAGQPIPEGIVVNLQGVEESSESEQKYLPPEENSETEKKL